MTKVYKSDWRLPWPFGHGPWPRAMTKRIPKPFILIALGHMCKIALEFEGLEFGHTA